MSPPGTGAKNSFIHSFLVLGLMPGLDSCPYCWMLHCKPLKTIAHADTLENYQDKKILSFYLKTNPNFSMGALGFMCFNFSMNVIKWEGFLTFECTGMFIFSLNFWIGQQCGSDWSDCLGSMHLRVLCCQVTPSSWICQEWVGQCSLFKLITNTANASSCIHGIPSWGTPKGDVAEKELHDPLSW